MRNKFCEGAIMKRKNVWISALYLLLALLLALPFGAMAQQSEGDSAKKLSKEQLAQLLAPIALYPDDLVSQILMASTYPLEVVQADRWAKKNKQSAGDVLAKQLEKEPWDPSVKSLVSFPTVLASMSEKLDVTTKIGDAFLAQQKDVMETIQMLRKKAQEAGNLKTTKEQKVIVEKEIIIIQSADPQVIYVPTYSPTVVYGTWMYPAYPPYYYYPPPPPYYPAYTLPWESQSAPPGITTQATATGMAILSTSTITTTSTVTRTLDINRGQGGQGAWKHNPEHRKGVAYKDGATAKQYGQSPARSQQGRSDDPVATAMQAAAEIVLAEDRGVQVTSSAGTMDRGGRGAGSQSVSRHHGPGRARQRLWWRWQRQSGAGGK